MNFLFPLGFLFALTLPIIVVMYLLRLRRQKVTISSILLWRKSLEDLQANAPFQKLRNNLLLWLQLLAAAGAVFALARPIANLAGARGQSYVALVDVSASMKTREIEGERIELARKGLEQLINDMSKGDEMMIVSFARESRIEQTFTTDKALLQAAARGLKATDETSRVREALELARSVAGATFDEKGETLTPPARNVEIVLFTDGKIADLDRSPSALPPVKYIPIGKTDNNVGIVDMELRESFDREPETQLFVTVENFSQAKANTELQLRLNDNLIDAKPVEADAGGRTSVIFSGLRDRTGDLELRIAQTDALDVDNRAYGVLSPRAPAKTLLVSSGNYFLQTWLANAPNNKVWVVAPGEYTDSAGYDITVFDNFAPLSLGPGSYIFFHALPPLEGFTAAPEPIKQPLIVDWNRVHPLTRYVKFDLVNIFEALDVAVPSWTNTLAEGLVGPLIFSFERDQRQCVVIAFDLFESDWMLSPSFPVFMANSFQWLTRTEFSGKTFAYKVGATIPFAGRGGVTQAEVDTPSGDKQTLDLSAERVALFGRTDETGYYTAKAGDQTFRFAVNLASTEESSIAPATELTLRDRKVEGDISALKQNREIWGWFVLAALAVLFFEWIVYCRRACL